MIHKPKVGLLPLHLELYDQTMPAMRQPLEQFLDDVANLLAKQGLEIVRVPVCRVASEFRAAVARIEAERADLIVSLHLAYSPSLESADVLAGSSLPLLILDTTLDYDFGRGVDPKRILYNHGIHGVQDLASVLRRSKKPYHIVAGHYLHGDVLPRAAGIARAALAARKFRRGRALRVGESFRGMGDFHLDDGELADQLGIEVTEVSPDALAPFVREATAEMIDREIASDRRRFDVDVNEGIHRSSVRVGLGLRRYLEEGRYDAFSVNFLAFDGSNKEVDVMPFLEISKAMERGIGYGGEGDVLTASLVGALSTTFGRTTFTEIFCSDWKGDTIFLSHMGEINPAVAAGRPLLCERDFPFTKGGNPAFLACAPAPGPAVFVNVAPGPDKTVGLIVAPVEVLEDGTHPDMKKVVRGWIRSKCGAASFLEEYSRFGGTHHSALVLGEHGEALTAFAKLAGLACHVIE